MTFNPNYRDTKHRDNIGEVVERLVQGEAHHVSFLDKRFLTAGELPRLAITNKLFGIPEGKCTSEELATAENLLRYVSKRHAQRTNKSRQRRNCLWRHRASTSNYAR